jgi:capsular polysaccharide transport system permease protein
LENTPKDTPTTPPAQASTGSEPNTSAAPQTKPVEAAAPKPAAAASPAPAAAKPAAEATPAKPAPQTPAAPAKPAPEKPAPAKPAPAKPVPAPAAPAKQAAPAKPASTKAAPAANPTFTRPFANPARLATRHKIGAITFALVVALPVLIATIYLTVFAQDQYVSTTAFSVRSEAQVSSSDLLGSISGLGGSSSRDTDVLYQFIGSQSLVSKLDQSLDLRTIYSKGRFLDPWYTFNPDSPIEDLVDYWKRVVRVNYDNSSGILEVDVHAFTPEDATRVAEGIFAASAAMINDVSAVAREDSTRYAREDLDLAIERLKAAREAMTAFRISTQIVDPSADIAGQVGLVNELQNQLAQALLENDLLTETARTDDPRLTASARRIDVIRKRIEQERNKFSAGEGQGDLAYARIISEFERLTVDLEFAEAAYKLALGSFDGASADAQRRSRYLAAHEPPTVAQSSQYPRRLETIALILVFSAMIWAIGILVFYSMRDRH